MKEFLTFQQPQQSLTSSATALSLSGLAIHVPPNLCTCQWAPLEKPSTALEGDSASTLCTTHARLPRYALLPLRQPTTTVRSAAADGVRLLDGL